MQNQAGMIVQYLWAEKKTSQPERHKYKRNFFQRNNNPTRLYVIPYLRSGSRQFLQNLCPQEACHGSLKTLLQIGHVSRSSGCSTNLTTASDSITTPTHMLNMIVDCFYTLHFAILYDSNDLKSLFLARASNQNGSKQYWFERAKTAPQYFLKLHESHSLTTSYLNTENY